MNNLGSSVAPEAKIPHEYFKTSGSGRHILFDFRRLVFVLNMKHATIHLYSLFYDLYIFEV